MVCSTVMAKYAEPCVAEVFTLPSLLKAGRWHSGKSCKGSHGAGVTGCSALKQSSRKQWPRNLNQHRACGTVHFWARHTAPDHCPDPGRGARAAKNTKILERI